MNKTSLLAKCWDALDEELDSCIAKHTEKFSAAFGDMIRYQLGWNGVVFDRTLSGKRLRPVILLLINYALGGDWRQALPAAAAVELVHNFSLVHDDIQDRSEKRRGRDTVWVKWGEAQAINTGDALLALANLEMLSLRGDVGPGVVQGAIALLNKAVFELTKGQYLDLAHENTAEVSLSDYFAMVEGKTGALFSACFALGALLGGRDESGLNDYFAFGKKLGLAFQIQDDYLGIWGQDETTGKSTEADLLSKKRTYPVHYALEHLPDVRHYWREHTSFDRQDAEWVKSRLEKGGVDKLTLVTAKRYYAESMAHFNALFRNEEKSQELWLLIQSLLSRTR